MSPRKWWVGTSDAPMVALWPDRRQSSPRRSFSSPCSSTWQMAKERAAKQSPGGGCRSTPMPVTEGRATVGTAQWSGAAQGPMTRPSRQFVEERLCMLLVPGPGGFPRHVGRVLPPKPVEPLRVGVALVRAWPPPRRGADRPQQNKAEVHVLLEVVGRRVAHATKQAIEHDALKGSGRVLSDVSGAHVRGQSRQPRGGVVFGVLDKLPELSEDVLADASEIVAPLPAELEDRLQRRFQGRPAPAAPIPQQKPWNDMISRGALCARHLL